MPLQAHGVSPDGNVLKSLVINRLEQHGGRCRPIAGRFMHLPEHLAQIHRPYIFTALGEHEDAAGDNSAVV